MLIKENNKMLRLRLFDMYNFVDVLYYRKCINMSSMVSLYMCDICITINTRCSLYDKRKELEKYICSIYYKDHK